MIGSRIGGYEIVSRLGEGGMGAVYRARDTKLNRDVALKVLLPDVAMDPERLARFRREAQVLASLNHPHIGAIHGLEERAGTIALVLELVDGPTLAEKIAGLRAQGLGLHVDEALEIAKQIAEALEAAHEQGIVHRDLKPANIKVRDDGTVKVLDFGLAKALGPSKLGPYDPGLGPYDPGVGAELAPPDRSPTITSPAHMTGVGVILGTAAYMAPEQAKGRSVDRRADIWAFGCVLFEMLAGRAPFAGDGITEILARIIEREPDFTRLPAGTPPHVVRVLRRCLQKDLRLRTQHIGDARLDLDQPVAESSTATATAAPGSRLAMLLPWAVAFAISLAAAATAWRTTPSSAPPRASSIEISYPEGVEGVASIQDIAVAPDGKSVAMIGSKEGALALFLRSVDGLDARLVSRPPNPSVVVFSPDGTSLGVLSASGDIWLVSPSDNDAKVVAKGVDVSTCGLALSPAAIVFCRQGALWTAASPSGEERQLTTVDTNRNEVGHETPVVVDRLVLFSSFTNREGEERIEAVPLGGGVRKVVVDRAIRPMMSPSGHLLFVRDGELMAAPFDVPTSSLTGAARVVGSGVGLSKGHLPLFPGPVLSANGSLLRPAPGFSFQQVIVVDRQGGARPLGVPGGTFQSPRLTADGSRLLLTDQTTLYAMDIARGTMTVTAGPRSILGFPLWSRDGSRAIFRDSAGPAWVETAGWRRTGRIPHAGPNDHPSGAGPDGDSVVATRVGLDSGGDVYLFSLSGAFEPRPLVQSRAFDGGGSFSADGRWLVYQSAESGTAEIYIRPYPALDRAWQVSAGGGVQARWNSSGKEIYYRNGAKMLGVSIDLSRGEPVLQKPVMLFESEGYGSAVATANYDVMPDGRFIMLRPLAGASRLILTTNWVDELTKALAIPGS